MDQALAQLGVYAVTILVMGLVGKVMYGYFTQELARRAAVIEAKDKIIEGMLPVLTEARTSMEGIAAVATDLLQALAVTRDRETGKRGE